MIAPLLLAALAPVQDVCHEADFALEPPRADARLGWAVAVDGDTAAAGAPFADGAVPLAGRVRLFERAATGWVAAGELVASDGEAGDGFGSELALDGDRLVVGAVWEDAPGTNSGAAYVFERAGGAWAETAKLEPSDHAPMDWFGRAVAVDGDRVAVGASLKATPAFGQGATYVFELSGGAWVETAKLVASDGGTEHFFGGSLDLDGDRLLVSAHGSNDLAPDSGGAYVFDLAGGAWVETTKLVAADGQANDDLGVEVALAGDTAVLGSFGDDDAALDAGSAYVFERGPGGAWSEAQELLASDAQPGDEFSSGLWLDGDLLAVGAQGADAGAGAVYAFRRAGPGAPFVEETRIDGEAAGERLGFEVAASGELVVAGAPDAAASSGEARAFRLAGDAALFGCPAWIALGDGGAQELFLDLGAGFAGDLYLVAGSASGTSPGFAFDGLAVPLNPDGYFLFSVAHANLPPYQATFAALDGAGAAAAAIALPAGADPTLAGATLVHAAAILDPTSLAALAVTGAEALAFAP